MSGPAAQALNYVTYGVRDRANDIKNQALSIRYAEAMRSFSRGSRASGFVEAYLERARRA